MIRETLQIYYIVRLRDFRWKGNKISTLTFEAKYYLVGPKVILMAVYSCKLIIHYSLPLNNHSTEPVIFHTNCVPSLVNKMNLIPTFSSPGKFPKWHYISELIKLHTAQNTSFKITLKLSGLFQIKTKQRGLRIWNLQGHWRNSKWNFKRLIKNRAEFPG